MCLESHEAELKKAGLSAQQIQTGLRIAAVAKAVACVLAAEAASQPAAVPVAAWVAPPQGELRRRR